MAPLAAQTITVTSPATGASWSIGSPYTIAWTKTGTMQATAAIRLRAACSSESDPAALAIANGTENDGSFSWMIPATVAPGSYFIRVRTDDSTVIGDSATFTIKSRGTQAIHLPEQRPLPPDLLKFPCLEVSGIDLAPNTEGFAIVFSYKNVGKGALPKASEMPVKKLRFHCPGEFYHDVELHPGQHAYSYAHNLIYKVPQGQNWTLINASAYLVPLPGGGEKLLDIDLRNNQGSFRFERPPRPADSQ